MRSTILEAARALTSGLAGATLALAAGCGGADAPAAAPACEPPRALDYVVEAGERVNPDDEGRALATVVRVYQLRDTSRLADADFDDVWLRGAETLAEDLVRVEEHTLFPKERVARRVALEAGVTAVVAVALFRKPAGDAWRAIHELPLDPCKAAGGRTPAPPRARFTLDDYQVDVATPTTPPARPRGAR